MTAQTRADLHPVATEEPFVYPLSRHDRLDGHSFVKWQHLRWLSSALCLMGSFEVKGMARDLFDLAQTQSPVGTLPRDTALIARLLRADPHHFEALCRHPFGPLRGWRPCLVDDGEIRLYHPVVLEQVRDAIERREARALKNSEKAVAARRARLIQALRDLGCVEAMLADDVLIARMDDWLAENWKRRRDQTAYERVLIHAQREGWLGPRRGGSSAR